MTAPLNGQLLNGARPYTDWAWGWARAEATATAEPVVNRVYADARGTAVAEATSSGIPDRLAFLDATQHPYAESHIEATRYAAFSADARATAELPLEATRLAWMDAPTLQAGAESAGYAERWKIVTGSAEAVGEVALDDAAITRISLAFNRLTPGQARSWMAESHLKLLRVRQLYTRSTMVGRATLRAIPNSAIGRARTELGAEVSANYLRVNVYHAFRGASTSISQTIVDPDRIRIIEGGAVATASSRAEPTIERDGQRFSYNSAAAFAESHATLAPTVLRLPSIEPVSAEAQFARAETFYRRGMLGTTAATASMQLSHRTYRWRRVHGVLGGSASLETRWILYRWREVRGAGTATASVSAESLRIRPMTAVAIRGQATSYSTLVALRFTTESFCEAQADGHADAWVTRLVAGAPSAIAALEIEAFNRRGRLMEGVLSALAESTGEGLRVVRMEPSSKQAVAATTRFVYRINIDGEAPTRRTIILSPSSRFVALPAPDREYRVA